MWPEWCACACRRVSNVYGMHGDSVVGSVRRRRVLFACSSGASRLSGGTWCLVGLHTEEFACCLAGVVCTRCRARVQCVWQAWRQCGRVGEAAVVDGGVQQRCIEVVWRDLVLAGPASS